MGKATQWLLSFEGKHQWQVLHVTRCDLGRSDHRPEASREGVLESPHRVRDSVFKHGCHHEFLTGSKGSSPH